MDQPINAFTIDVEDYFHVTALSRTIARSSWESIPPRVEQSTRRVLDVLDEFGVKGTFFVLGWVAERFPALVREIDRRGHEVACHGYSHQLVYEQTPEEFREETIRAKGILEEIIGRPVAGYRAASYSITPRSYWAIEILCEAGFSYDSSIFPIVHDRYGDRSAPRFPYTIEGEKARMLEFPLSTWQLPGLRLPVSGGGYFRLLPYWLIRKGLDSINRRERMPFIFYLHPWELDPEQPRVATSAFSAFRHYSNLDKTEARLRRLLQDFRFTTVQETLDAVSSTLAGKAYAVTVRRVCSAKQLDA